MVSLTQWRNWALEPNLCNLRIIFLCVLCVSVVNPVCRVFVLSAHSSNSAALSNHARLLLANAELRIDLKVIYEINTAP